MYLNRFCEIYLIYCIIKVQFLYFLTKAPEILRKVTEYPLLSYTSIYFSANFDKF